MHALIVIILPASILLAKSSEVTANHTTYVHDLMDNVVENMFNHLSDRAFKASPVHHVELNQATLGKPSHLLVSRANAVLEHGIAAGHGMHQKTRGRRQVGIPAHHSTPCVKAAIGLPRAGCPAFSHRVHVAARAMPSTDTEYEVSQPRPTGVKWKKCPDGGIYVADIDGNADPRVQRGDKLLEVSANFGDKIWKAESYQQCMMAIKTRIGPVYMKILSRGGNIDVLQMQDERSDYELERAGGNYGAGTEAEMEKRYAAGKLTEKDRKKLFEEGLSMFKASEFGDALSNFQLVISLEPKGYIGDRFERYTQYYQYSAYNVACCYSALKEEEAGLGALRQALESGWDDYGKIRTDEKLEFLRQSPKFKPLLEQFDEPVFNTEMFKNFKNPFR